MWQTSCVLPGFECRSVAYAQWKKKCICAYATLRHSNPSSTQEVFFGISFSENACVTHWKISFSYEIVFQLNYSVYKAENLQFSSCVACCHKVKFCGLSCIINNFRILCRFIHWHPPLKCVSIMPISAWYSGILGVSEPLKVSLLLLRGASLASGKGREYCYILFYKLVYQLCVDEGNGTPWKRQ